MIMSEERDARDAAPVAVEGDLGARSTFDGNHTNALLTWLVPDERWTEDTFPGNVEVLMEFTANGHLAWCLFPPHGYVVPDYGQIIEFVQ